jgi:hypothetical protein
MDIVLIALVCGMVINCCIFAYVIVEFYKTAHKERKELYDRIQSGSLLEFKNLQEKPQKPKSEQSVNKRPNFI